MKGLPDSWRRLRVAGSGRVLIGFVDDVMHVIAPPGVRLLLDESNEARVLWRHAIWMGTRRGGTPVLTIDAPDEVSGLDTRQVVEMLPAPQQEFVRLSMASQLAHAWAYLRSDPDACIEERWATISGRTFAWVTAQLLEAFPSETWFNAPVDSVEIPDTATELIQRMPLDRGLDDVDQGVRGWLAKAVRLGGWSLVRREACVESGWTLLSLRCQLWAAGLSEHLRPLSRGRSSALGPSSPDPPIST